MRKINVAEDIVPIGEFKTHASELIRRMHGTGRPMVITQNGRPAAVVLTPEEYEELDYSNRVSAKVKAGIASAETKTYTSAEVRERALEAVRARAKGR